MYRLFDCPICVQHKMFWNQIFQAWECLNKDCDFFDRSRSEFNPPERRK